MGSIGVIAGDIEGVHFTPLRQIRDERGSVMRMMRADDAAFEGFGEVYFSTVKAGTVKAWKRHLRMIQNLAVPVGSVRFVIYDGRPDSPTCGAVQEIVNGANYYGLLRIPPLVWYGFEGIGDGEALIANCASLPHDPAEVERLPERSAAIPYSWGLQR